jgi:hemoglobin
MYKTVNKECIAALVDNFYGKVRSDELLGPVFVAAIGSDWTAHLERMNSFWASVLLAAGTYKGNPMIAHLQLPRLTRPHFERWLQLWRETACALCSQAVARLFIDKAEMIAERFQHAISSFHEMARREFAIAPQIIQ